MVIGFAISFALALIAERRRWLVGPVTQVSAILYTVPTLAAFFLLIPITGRGFLTAQVALVAYTLLILFRGVRTGLDGVPPEILAQLTWQQVRIRLREIAVPGASATRYFALSDQTCRLLMAARSDSSERSRSTSVFVLEGGQAWQPEALARMLAAISVR